MVKMFGKGYTAHPSHSTSPSSAHTVILFQKVATPFLLLLKQKWLELSQIFTFCLYPMSKPMANTVNLFSKYIQNLTNSLVYNTTTLVEATITSQMDYFRDS